MCLKQITHNCITYDYIAFNIEASITVYLGKVFSMLNIRLNPAYYQCCIDRGYKISTNLVLIV